MSEMAKKARAAMKERVQRIAAPAKGDIDASGWREPTMNTTEKMGMRPVSKRVFKRGGKVNMKAEGEHAHKHAGRKPRKSGGMTVDDLINRDMKMANEKRGYEKVGGYKEGGKTGKWIQGAIKHPGALHKALHVKEGEKIPAKKLEKASHAEGKLGKRARLAKTLRGMHAKGGKVHDDVAEDKKLIKSMVKPGAMKKASGGAAHTKGCACKACGGRAGKKDGGFNWADAAKTGASVGAMGGGLLPMIGAGILGGMGKKKSGGSVHGKGCTCKACSGRSKHADGGKTGNYEGGTRPTGGRIARKEGGRTKSKTNIHINISTQPKQPDMMGMPPMPLPPPPRVAPVPMPPPGGAAGAMPMGMPAGAPPMPAPMSPPGGPMMRKAGGRVYRSAKDMDAGAGSGLGRLEKTEIQKRK